MQTPTVPGNGAKAAAPVAHRTQSSSPEVSAGQPGTARPRGLPKARDGKSDNLQLVSGIGPKLEKTLQGLGIYHFDQIAAWTDAEVRWVDEHLRFKGRIARDEWVAQANLLAAGDMDRFTTLYGSGGLKDRAGRTQPGSRTRNS